MMDTKAALSLLFDRPKEPIFMEKGDKGVIFEVPESFVADRFKSVAQTLMNSFGDEKTTRVKIKQCSPVPDVIQFTKGLERDASFSLLNSRHSKLAGNLITYFMSLQKHEDLLSSAAFIRDRTNPQLFNYALTVCVLHRKDLQGVRIPSLVETFPEKFIDSRVIRSAREDLSIIPSSSRTPIVAEMQMTSSSRDPEQKLWYFREDIGANLHHWHWHLVYPFDSLFEIVNKHRRGKSLRIQ
jgi:tyrosinase